MTASTVPPIETVVPGVRSKVDEGSLGGPVKGLFTVGILALGASLAGWFMGGDMKKQFFFSYLVAYMFTLSLALGALFFVMVQHLTRAGWSVVVRRIAENMASTMPWLAILFIPIVVGSHDLYHHWMSALAITDTADPRYDPIIHGKSGYLNETFFYVRMALYFVIWVGLTRYFVGASLRQDESGDPKITLRMARVAAPGMLLFALSLTFAAFDWMMSIDPHWFSTMFGVCYFAGSFMAFCGMLALVLMWLGSRGYLKDVVNVEHYHDIGKLLFAFMVFWTYVNFSQYFLIHYADIPEETLWYQHREKWSLVGQILIVGHFFLPFAFLMSRHIKRNPKTLLIGALLMLAVHWFDMVYIIMPNFHHAPHWHWLDFTCWAGLLFIFLALTIRATANRPLLPVRDPRLRESVNFHNV